VIREIVLSNANLAAIGLRHNLNRCVHLNPGTTAVSDKTMATTVEAILGAVHVDGGDAALGLVMAKLGLRGGSPFTPKTCSNTSRALEAF
jgi:ribonuclease III